MEYQFKIQLKGITKPPVWRKIIIPANFTFLKFHQAIQIAFGTMPDSKEAHEYREWLGLEKDETWDVNDFDIDQVNEEFKLI